MQPASPHPVGEPVNFDCDGYSDAGPVRERNEDAWMATRQAGVVAVCDGMGGHDAGDYASGYIVARLERLKSARHHGAAVRAISSCLSACNRHLIDHARSRGFEVVGSTAVVLHLGFRRATVLWVGDSRAYRLRDRVLRQITLDHVPVAPDVPGCGGPHARLPHSGTITRAVGASRRLEIDRLSFDVEPGDVWLLCSDGVSGVLTEQRIRALLEQDPFAARQLVREAIDGGSQDNCTAVVVRIHSPT